MNKDKKTTISWSGGKDSAFALYRILLSGEYNVVHLHTVINEKTRRVGMHGVHESLIEEQAHAIGIPLQKIYIAESENNEAYESAIRWFYKECQAQKISTVVFGDIFLEDLKEYRLALLAEAGMRAEFPLWGIDTRTLISDFVNVGFKTLICSANAAFFSRASMGTIIDETFITLLHAAVDPCGENGEFHTFVFDGPVFKKPVCFRLGDVVEKKYNYLITTYKNEARQVESSFWFQDIVTA